MKKTIKFIFLTLFIWILFAAFSAVNAASATIKANKTTVSVGDSVKVTVTVNAAAWNLKVTGSATGDIIGYNPDAENKSTTKTYTIDTSRAGTYKVTLSGDITDEAKDNADPINTSVSITVKEKATTTTDSKNNTSTTKSSNAYLSTLGVTPKEYDFSGFSKTKYEYNVTVPSDVNSLKVVYKTADSKATVNVSGNSGFEVGSNNKITIKVTAEDGKTSKTYQIKVTKLATEEEKPGNLIEEEKNLYLKSLEIEGVNLSPEFSSDIYAYTADIETDITQVKINAKANNEKAKIEITGNENLVDGENLINVIVIGKDESTKVVYQITLNKAVNTIGSTVNNDQTNQENSDDALKLGKKAVRIIIIVIATIIIFIVIISVLLVKENKRLKKIDEENLFKNNEIQNLNDIPKTEDKDKIYKRGGKH